MLCWKAVLFMTDTYYILFLFPGVFFIVERYYIFKCIVIALLYWIQQDADQTDAGKSESDVPAALADHSDCDKKIEDLEAQIENLQKEHGLATTVLPDVRLVCRCTLHCINISLAMSTNW